MVWIARILLDDGNVLSRHFQHIAVNSTFVYRFESAPIAKTSLRSVDQAAATPRGERFCDTRSVLISWSFLPLSGAPPDR